MTAAPPGMADVFGRAYQEAERAGCLPGRVRLVYEMESGGTYAEDAAVYFAGPDAWPAPDAAACAIASGRVLDLGCGPGRHTAALRAAGHEVVGVDAAPEAVAAARRRGVDARLGDLRDPPAGLGTFDTLLLLGAGLALVTTDPERPAVLRRLAALAAPGARLLGTDIRVAGEEPPAPARLRARVEGAGPPSPWSAWSGGRPYLPPEELAAAVQGTGWRLEELGEPDAAGLYLACLRSTG